MMSVQKQQNYLEKEGSLKTWKGKSVQKQQKYLKEEESIET